KTEIADDVFIGSDTQLIAPVKIAKGATVGAGATINRDIGEGELVITRAPARTIKGWKRPVKQK
ncbi:bifunctional UDP-N-acetylglucosamine diphosphorylase/glucosamine-1-phosphate N-acetyltransferase GlmU, partial [Photobacterium sp. MCCC 1A19761]